MVQSSPNVVEPFPCFVARRDPDGKVTAHVETAVLSQLPPGDVLIETVCSSLNYKDALAAQGHPGVAASLPHVPGIDCAGHVVDSQSLETPIGQRVLVTGYELGSGRWGGFARYVRVPHDWVVAIPDEIPFEEAMTYGTAGFTAAQAVDALQRHGVAPDCGEVVVTGASGGVGTLSVCLLAQLGYRVVAVTGKERLAASLLRLGAQRVAPRSEALDTSGRPLLTSRWAGGIDTVGGPILATLVRQLGHRGCIAACGLTAGDQLPLTVFPFILRGAVLAGIDSAQCPRASRLEIWRKLFGPWRMDLSRLLVRSVDLRGLSLEIGKMLAGEAEGRTLVRPT